MSPFREDKKQVLSVIFLEKQDLFNWDHEWESKAVVPEKFEIQYADESKSLAQSEYSDYQNSEVSIRLNIHLLEHCWTRLKVLIETLTERIGL